MGKGRAPCCDKSKVRKGAWTPEEDTKLITHIHQFGYSNWRYLPAKAGLLRCGKSCRLRWINYLRPDVKRGNFTLEEEQIILNLHKEHGNKWSKIASVLPGRTDNEIKNMWNTHLKKKLEASGVSTSVSSSSSTTSSKAKDDKETHSMSSIAKKTDKILPIPSTVSKVLKIEQVTVENAKVESFAESHDIKYSMSSNQERHNKDLPVPSTISNISSIEQVKVEKMKQENFAESNEKLPSQTTPSDLDMEFWFTLESMGSIFSYDDNQTLNFWERTR